MKRVWSCLLICSVAVAALSLLHVQTASAFPQFATEFQKKYVGDETSDAQKSLAEEIKRVNKCNVCHDPRKGDDGKVSKKNRNPYGMALSKLLTKDDKKDVEKIHASLDKIEALKADDAGATFGDLLKQGKVPFEYK